MRHSIIFHFFEIILWFQQLYSDSRHTLPKCAELFHVLVPIWPLWVITSSCNLCICVCLGATWQTHEHKSLKFRLLDSWQGSSNHHQGYYRILAGQIGIFPTYPVCCWAHGCGAFPFFNLSAAKRWIILPNLTEVKTPLLLLIPAVVCSITCCQWVYPKLILL